MVDTYDNYEFDKNGVLKQKDLTPLAVYNPDYVRKYENFAERNEQLNYTRLRLLKAVVPKAKTVLDYGCGTGTFVEIASRFYETYGYDINGYPTSFNKVSEEEMFHTQYSVVSFFDSLEHVPDPHALIEKLNPKYIYISVPECHYPEKKKWFMNWKHRRYGEHLWHFNRYSLDFTMWDLGYKRLVHSNLEDRIRTPYSFYLSNILTAIYKSRD